MSDIDPLQGLAETIQELPRQARYAVCLAAAPVQQHAVVIGLITDPEASRTAAVNLREAAEHATDWSDHSRQTARDYASWFEQQANRPPTTSAQQRWAGNPKHH